MNDKQSAPDIFQKALEIADANERTAYLDKACGKDAGLRGEVESLLTAHEAAGEFLEPLVTPELEVPGEKEGDQIGRYKLWELIGEGGFGRVWMAEQQEPMRRMVALKIVKLGMDTSEVLGRFESERQALAMMDHPHIAKVFDGGATESGRPYFVMELVRGVPITEYCDVNKLSPRERIDLFQKVCQAVQHAHQKGVIHRDLKPTNILVTVQDDKPVPKVIDFGVAKALQARLTERTLFTRFSQWIGTPAYMSPEQAGLGSHDVDTRSDVYSLGTVLYELLTGSTPFDSQKLREQGYEAVLRTIREEDVPKASTRLSALAKEEIVTIAGHRSESPEKLDRDIKGELDWILLKALERDRSRRYETVSALTDDLRRYADGTPILAAPPTFVYLAGKFINRHRRVASSVAAGIVLMLVAGTAVSVWYSEKEARAQQEQAGQDDTKVPSPKPFGRTGESLLAALKAHDAEVCEMVYSRDLNMLASCSFDGTVKLWAAETGELLATLQGHDSEVWGIAFSPDGGTLASAGFDGKILLWDVKTREIRATFKEGSVSYPREGPIGAGELCFSPDGKFLAVPGVDSKSIHFWELETGIRSTKIKFPGRPWRFAFSPDGTVLAVAVNDTREALSLWLVESGENLWSRQGDRREVTSLTFSPDGKTLATGNADHRVRLWNTAEGTVLKQMPISHPSWVWSVAFSPDGKTLASASSGDIFLWDVEKGEMLTTLDGHYGYTSAMRFYADGRTLATAGTDREIKIWDVPAALAKEKTRVETMLVAAAEERKKLPPAIAVDEFDGKLGLKWKIHNSDPSHVSLTKKAGALTITSQEGGINGTANNAKNLFLVENPIKRGGNYTVTVCLDAFRPKSQWNQAGLLLFNDGDNYLKCAYSISNRKGTRLALLAVTNGKTVSRAKPYSAKGGRVWLRVTKRGKRFSAFYSDDGIKFIRFAELWWKIGEGKWLGLYAKNGAGVTAPEIDASFDYFEVREPTPEPVRVITPDKIEDRNDIIYEVNQATPFTGLVQGLYPNGQKSIEANVKDGKAQGVVTKWYENGKKKSEVNYKDGLKHGVETRWHKNGMKWLEGNFKDGKQHGVRTEWHKNGQKRFETNYKDGKAHGLYTKWDENGTKAEVNYKDGKMHGVETRWHKNGQKSIEGNFKDGKKHGVRTEWHENGQKKSEVNYKDGKRQGVKTEWHKDGTKKEFAF